MRQSIQVLVGPQNKSYQIPGSFFISTIFPRILCNMWLVGDNTDQRESGDVMYDMEYNADKLKAGSGKPGQDSYYQKGGAGEYSRRVEEIYKERKKQTQGGNPPSYNPYPLPKEPKNGK